MSSAQVPEGYKQTEVGVIPEEWRISSVGEEFDVQLGKMLDVAKNTGSLKPYIANRSIQWGRFDLSNLPLMAMSSSDMKRFRLEPGDLLVCEGGEVGRAAIWNALIEECYYQKAIHRLRPLKGFNLQLMIAFLKYWSDSDYLTDFVTQTSIAHLTKEKFVQVPLPVPPPAEQQTIAQALSDIDALIASLDKLIAKQRQLKTAAMQQLLTGKMRLPGFSGSWRKGILGNECSLITKGTTPTSLGHAFKEQGINFIKIESVTEDGNILFEKLAYIDAATHALLNRSQLQEKDILFSIAGALGRCALVKNDLLPANTNQALAIIRLKTGTQIDQKFLLTYLKSTVIQEYIDTINVQAAQANLSLENINNFEIIIPSIEEQRAIATVLSDMDTAIAALETRRAKTQAIKQGMMQELLTGRTRLV
jgi:type I restriction enzyme, S subunit